MAAIRRAARKPKDDTIRIRKFPNVGMALGSYIKVPTIDGWIKERGGIGTHVNWVHTKFMLVDPLGDTPVVVTGSANWSLSSINANDENLVVIKGSKRVADIYFGEFMRIFPHYRFREASAIHPEKHGSLNDWTPQDLFDKPSEWNGCPGTTRTEASTHADESISPARNPTHQRQPKRCSYQVIASLRSYRSRPTTCLSARIALPAIPDKRKTY